MRRWRWWIGGPLALVGFAAAGFVAWSVLASQPEPTGQHRPPAGLDAAVLDAHAGLYRDAGGRALLVVPSAQGGLALFRVDDYVLGRGRDLGRVTRDGGAWRLQTRSAGEVPFHFEHDASGRAVALSWQGEPDAGAWSRDPAPAYTVHAVEFGSSPRLSGTVFLPRGADRMPGAVLIHGSGDSDRDGLWYLLVARTLAERGIAVLLPDKRGSGRSEGDWRTASFDALAADALAGLDRLAGQPGVDPANVGLVGMSQGGWIAPLAATQSPRVAFVASLAAAAVSPREQTRHEIRQELRAGGAPDWLAPALMPVVTRMPARRLPEWWRLNGDFDPVPLWRQLRQRGLVVLGNEDERDNVPVAESVRRLRSLDRPASRLQVATIDGSGHGLLHPDTGELHPRLRAALVAWILEGGSS